MPSKSVIREEQGGIKKQYIPSVTLLNAPLNLANSRRN